VPHLKKLAAELITIVLGVLIALGVDDWRQGREEAGIANDHLVDLTAEMRQNLCTVERIRARHIPRKLEALQTVIAFLNDPTAKVAKPDELLHALARSGATGMPWLVDNQYQALQNSGNVRLVRKLHPTLEVGSIYEAPEVLFSQADRIEGAYPKVVNELLPAQLQPQFNSMRSYVRDETVIAPAVADDPDLAKAIEAIRARRAELLPLARNEVAATTSRWYSLIRLSTEMKKMIGELKPWDQSTTTLEAEMEECRSARSWSAREQKPPTAASKP
jgi:hypothetical protein